MQKTFYGVIGALIVIDRLLKAAALQGTSFSFVPGSVQFMLFKNAGIAFSIGLSGPLVWTISLAILACAIVVAARDLRAGRTDHLLAIALFVIGAASNLYDRVVYGYTVDYLIFFGRSAVNVADGMILAGVVLLLWVKPKSSLSSYARGSN